MKDSPLKRGNIHATNHSFPTRNKHSKSPRPREGPGVCYARAQLPKIKSIHPKQKNTTSPNSSKNTSTFAAPLAVTHPFIPSLEGKPSHQTSHYQQESSDQTSPLERGKGCVTSAHSLLKSKASTRSRQIPPHNTKTNLL